MVYTLLAITENRKDVNKRMLASIAVTGGTAFLVIVAFLLLIVFTVDPTTVI